jgi:twinkle protein
LKSWRDFGLDFPNSFTGQMYSVCPQCSPHRKKKGIKCLSANGESLTWLCHHCGFSGTLKDGVTNKADPFTWKEPTYVKPKYELKAAVPRDVLDWFHNRGITDKTLLRNKIRYEKVYMPQVEDFKDAIRFPYLRGGEVVNVKSRTLDKEFRLETNAERILYGMDDITGDEAIIVEGEIDKLSVEEAGLLNCVSVPNGAPAVNTKDYPAQFTFLESCEDLVTRVKTWILAVDNDEPGQKLEEELARRIGRHKCKRVKWSEGCKDVNDVLMKHGRNEVLSCIRGARDYPVEGIFEINDIITQIDALYNRPIHRGELTGWKCLDELYTVRAGEWTLVTGIPSSGKSEWVDALMVNLVKEKQWRFAVFSPENQPLELHFSKLAEKMSDKPFFGKDRMTQGDLAVAKEYINLYFTFILPAEEKSTIDGILDLARYVVLKKGIQGLVIDPWNEIDHSRPSTLSETEYISRSLSKIRRFARENTVHIWLVAHPTKLLKNPKTQTYPVPTPYDVAGSAHFRNKADNCIAIHRPGDPDDPQVDIHVQKIRFKIVGKVGMKTLLYDRKTGIYRDIVE